MSTNRYFTVLVVMALVLVSTLTVREALSTAAVLSEVEKAESAQAADAARWTAMGQYYGGVEAVQSRARAADAARWTAMGKYYENQAESQHLDRGQAADAARWTAMAEYYLQVSVE